MRFERQLLKCINHGDNKVRIERVEKEAMLAAVQYSTSGRAGTSTVPGTTGSTGVPCTCTVYL